MRLHHRLLAGASLILFTGVASFGEVKVTVDRNEGDAATAAFKFKNIPSPVANSAASGAAFTIVDGRRDPSGGPIAVLNDGKVPIEADEPGSNFFFSPGAPGGRIAVDLGKIIDAKQINTYSWHAGPRGPQVYTVYASDGAASDFDAKPKADTDPLKAGWKLLAKVDTRPKTGDPAGQYGVSIADSNGPLGKFRYLLFDVSKTESEDPFGNTFFSEINVVDQNAPTTAVAASKPAPLPPFVFHSVNPDCEIVIDTAGAPELKEWVETKLGPTLAEWYPKIVEMLPSEGYTAPKKFAVRLRPGSGVAATGRTNVTANSGWLKRELNREAVGALVHEEIHVVQQYGGVDRSLGWLVEGIPDYIRWYKFEPQLHGADITPDKAATARYNGAYRPSANFLNYVTEKYDKDLVKKLNAALRQHKPVAVVDDIWKQSTGKTVQELAEDWKKALAEQK